MQRKTRCDKGDQAAEEATFSPQIIHLSRFKSLLYTEFREETGHLYTIKLLKLVTFLDELFLLTLLREQLLLTQCCWWLISCILGITEANVTWLERKSLLIHPYMEGKPKDFSFCSSRAKAFWYGLHNISGKPGSCLLWPTITKLCKIQSNGRGLQNSYMPISLHEKYHNPCKTKT